MASNSTPFNLKWGIMATGWIAESEFPPNPHLPFSKHHELHENLDHDGMNNAAS